METKFSGIFIDAWSTVLESFTSKSIMRVDVRPPQEAQETRDILVFMGIVGDIDAQIAMTMDAETGKNIASEMLGGIEITEVNDYVISAVGELCNMIMGNACSSISMTNTNVDITPPTVIADQSPPESLRKPTYNICILLEDLETIDFNVAMMTA